MDLREKPHHRKLRLNGTTETLDWFVGASYYYQDLDARVEDSFGSYSTGLGVPITEFNIGSSEVDSYGLFSDVIWSVTDRINLTFGARYSYDEKTQDIKTPNQDTLGLGLNLVFPTAEQLTDSEGNPDPSLASLEDDWDDLSLRGVIDYQLNDTSMLFFSISQGYKAGGFNSFPIVDLGEFFPLATPGQMEPYDEETVTSLELGIKSEWLDNRLRLNASLFYYEWEDLQIQVARDKALFTMNAGKAIGKGADIELSFQATDNLVLSANLGLLDAGYDEDVAGTEIKDGEDLLYSPTFSAHLGLDHYADVTTNWDLRTHLGYSYTDDQYLAPGYEESSYSLLNGRVSMISADDSWELALWGRNLADEDYLEQITDFSDIGYVSARRNEPRTYGAEVIYRFH